MTFTNTRDLILIDHLIKKYKRLLWQKLFEGSLNLSISFIYQFHFFLTKVNKRGKQQDRVVLITDKVIKN
jgi:hypothetical protein